jgi:hypothetical protein
VGRFFHFAYQLPETKGRPVRLHQIRDGSAFAEMEAVLAMEGHRYEGLILNHPGLQKGAPSPGEFRADDVLVLTTRPPLDDGDTRQGYRRLFPTELEKAVLASIRPHFRLCNRARVSLALEHSHALKPGYESRAEMWFRQYGDVAKYKKLRSIDSRGWQSTGESDRRTAAFLLRTRLLGWGPQIVVAFGMSGVETLGWAYLLRTRLWAQLRPQAPCFVMVELTPGPLPTSPSDLSFCASWCPVVVLRDSWDPGHR